MWTKTMVLIAVSHFLLEELKLNVIQVYVQQWPIHTQDNNYRYGYKNRSKFKRITESTAHLYKQHRVTILLELHSKKKFPADKQ